MRVDVDEAGDGREAAAVDVAGPRRRGALLDPGDAVALEDDRGGPAAEEDVGQPFPARPFCDVGAMRPVALRPTTFGSCSTFATSASSAQTRLRSSSPISLCAFSRPRNISVSLTLLPSARNARMLRILSW